MVQGVRIFFYLFLKYSVMMRSAANTPLLSNSISSIPLWVLAVNMNEFIKKTVRQIAAATPV